MKRRSFPFIRKESFPWLISSKLWLSLAALPGMVWAVAFPRNNRSKSGSVKRVWTGKSKTAPFISNPRTSGLWAQFTLSLNRRCCIAPIPRPRCQWSPIATRLCSPVKYWSSIEISPKFRATNWKPLEYSKAVASSGPWPVLGKVQR
ncbi:hypothetical protein D3C76_1123800 [compost metagenome]